MEINIKIKNDSNENKKVFQLLAKCFPEYWGTRLAQGEARFAAPIVSVIAECNGAVVGHCGIYIYNCHLGGKLQKTAGLCSVAVDLDFRGRGIAGKMCDSVLDYCKDNGIFWGPLYTGVPQVYEKRGWKIYDFPQIKEVSSSELDSGQPLLENNLNEDQRRTIKALYSSGYIFDGKVDRSDSEWNTIFSNKSFFWKLSAAGYALIIKDDDYYILSEAYSKDGNWKEVLDFSVSAAGKLLIYLPEKHPFIVENERIYNLHKSFIDIWHHEVAMVNVMNSHAQGISFLKRALEHHSLFFPLADKF